MAALSYEGSTSTFVRVQPGVILKYPIQVWKENSSHNQLAQTFAHYFFVERQIFEKLDSHPRIVKYMGYQDTKDMPQGLLLAEANQGNLQQYIDNNRGSMSPLLCKKWCQQAAEAIAYLHSKGVIHSDLRPANLLVQVSPDVDSAESLDIRLCDFGGSMYEELSLDGRHLPDSGFF